MELLFTKTQTGLVPSTEDAVDWLRKKKLGATILVEAKEPRNGAFHRKWFALVKLAYDYWADSVQTIEYKGERVLPDFDRFRKDVTILAGFYTTVANIKGEVRIEPLSLKWAAMTEESFSKLYEATIRVMLAKVFNGKICPKWSEEELRNVAEQILEFAA